MTPHAEGRDPDRSSGGDDGDDREPGQRDIDQEHAADDRVHAAAIVGRALIEMRAMCEPEPLAPCDPLNQRHRRIRKVIKRKQQGGRQMSARREQQKQPADQQSERQASDIAEEKPRHRAVERREAECRAEQRQRRDHAVGRQRSERSEDRKAGGDRQHFRDGHPVDAVHEIHEVEKPDAGHEHERSLDPPRQCRNDRHVGRNGRDHRGDRDPLQEQARDHLDRPDVVGRADERDQNGRRKNRREFHQRQSHRAENSNRSAPVTSNTAPITATPPPCGVGVVCDERAFGRASA